MTDRIPAPTNRDWPDRLYKWLLRNWGTTTGSSTPGAVNWGDIGGTLSGQTDLQTALDGKTTTSVAWALAQSAVSVHVALSDPHTQYMTKTAAASSFAPLVHVHAQTDVTGLVTALSGMLTSAVAYAIAQSAVSVHTGQADPHTVYLLKTAAASSYAPILHTHTVSAISTTNSPSASTYLRGDNQWTSVSASVSVGDSVTSTGGVVMLVNDTSVPAPVSFYGAGLTGSLGYLPGHVTVRTTSDSGAQTTSALTNAVGLAFSVASSVVYHYDFYILFRSAATTNGFKLGLTYPAATFQSGVAQIPAAADGTGGMMHGWITTSGDAVVAAGVQAANTTYCARLFGTINPSANGSIQVQFAGELNTTTGVTVMTGSAGRLYRIG